MNPMTQNTSPRRRRGIEEEEEDYRPRDPGAGAVMRVIVPLQGVVQGRGGVVLGSVIPCALFYLLQLYLRRHRSSSQTRPSQPGSSQPETHPPPSPQRTLSRSPSRPAFVSSRAAQVVGDSPYYLGWKAYQDDPYDAVGNPEGVIQMGLAENQLSLDLIDDWLKSHPEASSFGGADDMSLSIRGIAGYQEYYGMPDLRTAMADFMSDVMKVRFDSSRVILTAGATAAIEMLGFCLAEPGNAFLVPSPYYPGFDRDLNARAGVELVPVPCRSTDNFNVTITALERAFNQTKKKGVTVRALLITNPSNPVGNTLDSNMLTMLLVFAREKNIHLICDEVYAGSVYGSSEFTSIANVLESGEFDKSRVHIIYGASKDLGLPGLRVGVLYSYSDKIMKAAQKLTRFCSVSSQTQRLLIALLSDAEFIQKYMSENRRRLGERFNVLSEGLKNAGITCAKSNGGLFCWVAMPSFMPFFSQKGENILWENLLKEAKISVTPGSACHCIEHGWFRVCFATLSDHDTLVALQRFQKFCETYKRTSQE
uniref:TSA: Wollemia nobilis Ref_Wollemi_Transcript_25086_2288 transcribed RNA sequence n=1 Tax=Wollemia nobilis TaxID=56998 RepID=A0A0C9S1N4_9CONI